MRQPNTQPQASRAHALAVEIRAHLPGFRIIENAEDGTSAERVVLRREDGAGLIIIHHPGWGKQNTISISVETIHEAPSGTQEPRAQYPDKANFPNREIAFDFMVNHYEAMQQYWRVALSARQAELDHYKERLAFARRLAAAGNGVVRENDRNSDPRRVPTPYQIECFSKETAVWTVKYLSSNEMVIRGTDEQLLAIVALLASNKE